MTTVPMPDSNSCGWQNVFGGWLMRRIARDFGGDGQNEFSSGNEKAGQVSPSGFVDR
jgi:hypothetical protein